VVTHGRHPERFDELLRALARQDYPRLFVLVVDAAGGDDPTERVRARLPTARVIRVPPNVGFAGAANLVLHPGLPRARRAAYFLFCRDDVAPDPDAVTGLVDAAEEWQAGVVGPKFVARDDPRRLLAVGLAVDRVGTTLPLVERRELDQGQHDRRREVFAVTAGFTLVRARRFRELGGFDPAIDGLSRRDGRDGPDDDLILCWRARAAGARVLVAPDARVRPDEVPAAAAGPGAAGRQARHRLRALLGCSSRLGLIRVLPKALALSLAQAAWGLATLRPVRARAALGAWVWNLVRPLSLWRARRSLNRVRRVPDREIRRWHVRGYIGPRLRLRRMAGGGPASDGEAAPGTPTDRSPGPELAGADGDPGGAWTPAAALIVTALVAVLLFGSRHLVTRFVPAVGDVVAFPGGAGDLVREWSRGYRDVGLGAEVSAPGLVGFVGGLGTVLGDHLGLARTLLTVGLLPVGVVGAYRLLLPTGSTAAPLAAAVAYAAVPLPYDGLATGRWSVVAAYAAAPWLLGRLARASAVAPFPHSGCSYAVYDRTAAPSSRSEASSERPLWQNTVAAGLVTGVAGLLVPQAPALALLVGAALVIGGVLAFQGRGIGRLVTASLGAALVAALLHLPALIDVVRSRTAAEAWLGLDRPAGALDALDLLRFDTGPLGIAPLGYCLAGAAALPLLVGRSWRLGWAVRAWAVAVACWAAVWAQQEGHLAMRLPDAGVILAPGAAGLALAIALGVAAVELDVRGRSWRFGFRRTVSALGVLALAASTGPLVMGSLDGWWHMPRGDFAGVLGSVDEAVAAAPSRVLWVGDPAVLPGGAGWLLAEGLSYVAVDAATPGVGDLWPATGEGASDRLGEALESAAGGRTSRLGQMLAPMGVHYLAVPRSPAPASAGPADAGDDDGPRRLAAPGAVDRLVDALDGQLDLQQIAVDDAVALYRNVAFAPVLATGIDEAARAETSVEEMQWVDLSGASPVLVEADGDGYRGPVPSGETVVQASSASSHWVLEVEGRRAARSDAYGWATTFTTAGGDGGDGRDDDGGGQATLSYRTPLTHHLLLGAQGALWLAALAVAIRMRFGSERTRSEPGGAGASAREAPTDGEPSGDEPAPGGEPEAEEAPSRAPVGASP
jgi:GT2 family glycosyltransferase